MSGVVNESSSVPDSVVMRFTRDFLDSFVGLLNRSPIYVRRGADAYSRMRFSIDEFIPGEVNLRWEEISEMPPLFVDGGRPFDDDLSHS